MDTVIVHAYIDDDEQCDDWDTVLVSKTAPKLAGQVKYWNDVETPMPSPFPTEIYATVSDGVPSKGMLAWKRSLRPAELLARVKRLLADNE